MISRDNLSGSNVPDSRNLASTGNPLAIKVFRELLELCDFLLIPASAKEHTQAAPAIFSRLENSIAVLEHHVSQSLEEAVAAIEQVVTQSMKVDGLSIELKTTVIKARELIEHELHTEEISNSFTFEDTLKQIEHLCQIIQRNGPESEGKQHYGDALYLLDLIDDYRKDEDPATAGRIMEIVQSLESSQAPKILQARTGRPASQFKKIWSELMRKGIDVMHPHKAHGAICHWLRERGEPEDRLPSQEQIEAQYKTWIK